MTLSELKQLLADHPQHRFQLRLPDSSQIPMSFHVSEVGRVVKTFLDCGGTRREMTTCQLQVWVGRDYDHRLETKTMAGILDKGRALLPDESIPVEIEYEQDVISQYTVENHAVTDDTVILQLARKHTACLAPELCGPDTPALRLPAIGGNAGSSPCCGPNGCD